MSQALASARKRRGIPNTPEPPIPQRNVNTTAQPNVNTGGLTLPQVITIVDKRLTNLEQFMKETKENGVTTSVIRQEEPEQPNWIEEFNHRFEVLAEEIANMKDIVLKLQSYTMEVNKTLMEERINVFSDLGNNTQSLTLEDNDLTSVNLKNLVQQEFENVNDL